MLFGCLLEYCVNIVSFVGHPVLSSAVSLLISSPFFVISCLEIIDFC